MYSDDNFNNVIIILFFLIDEYNPERIIKVSEWLNSGSLYIDWSLNFNRLTALMVFLVNFVSTIVHVYSVGYMNNDDRRSIFLSYLGLFTFFYANVSDLFKLNSTVSWMGRSWPYFLSFDWLLQS